MDVKQYKQEKKEFKRLTKKQLIELLYELQYENDVLTASNKQLKEELKQKNNKIDYYRNEIKNFLVKIQL